MVLSLAQVVAEKTDALRVLEDAYDARLHIEGGRAIVLDAILDAARSKGLYCSPDLAAGVLRVSGRFRIERGPVGRWQAVRQSTALVPAGNPRSTALVPVPSNPSSDG